MAAFHGRQNSVRTTLNGKMQMIDKLGNLGVDIDQRTRELDRV
jgi:hypothetical protein